MLLVPANEMFKSDFSFYTTDQSLSCNLNLIYDVSISMYVIYNPLQIGSNSMLEDYADVKIIIVVLCISAVATGVRLFVLNKWTYVKENKTYRAIREVLPTYRK